jgi:deoxycytidylate deaminase
MEYLTDNNKKLAQEYFKEAANLAHKSTCKRSQCGSVIVADNQIIGRGFNSPPKNLDSQRKCSCDKDSYNKKVTDKTCCIHAEQRAIIDALRNNSKKLAGAKLYFIRLDNEGEPTFAGKPYCTICSKMALDAGVKEFILWHKDGICAYETDEYNVLSYEYNEK